ncbi:hypothetical protein [Apibacter mensalis]|uniref:hypothetical protein n=1 Tax=Apibacter mensalis TaxID=1586267 RepID=UPI0026EEEC2D|nr:hypothetical protein [Apibacter mensalis]
MKKIIILLLGISLLSSCLKPDCEGIVDFYRKQECIMILEKEPSNNQVDLDLYGADMNTGKPCHCKDNGRWWSIFSDDMSAGDIIIKRIGELVFYIHKKDTILSFPWRCEGKVYQ